MHVSPSQAVPSMGVGRGRRSIDDSEVARARVALEERYLTLLAARDQRAVEELQQVRVRLHHLAEIDADPTAPGRDAALRAWLRAA
jgi:hypothetical protein